MRRKKKKKTTQRQGSGMNSTGDKALRTSALIHLLFAFVRGIIWPWGCATAVQWTFWYFRLGADYGNAVSDIYRQEHERNCLALKQMLEGSSRQWIQLNLNQEEEEWLWWDSNNNSTNAVSLDQWKGQEGSPKTQSSHSPESFQPWKNPREHPGAMQPSSCKGWLRKGSKECPESLWPRQQ